MISEKQFVYDHYVDQDGLLTVDKDPTPSSTGNGLMHLGVFLALIQELDNVELKDKLHVELLISNISKEAGLLNRKFKSDELVAHDDYIGALSALLIVKSALLSVVVNYVLKHLFYINNTDKFTLNAFRIRNVFFVLFVLALKYKVFSYPLYLYMKSRSPKSYTIQLHYMVAVAMSTRNSFFKNLIKKYLLRDELVRYYKSEYHGFVQLYDRIMRT